MGCTVTSKPGGGFSVQHKHDCTEEYCLAEYQADRLNRAMKRMELQGHG